MGLEIVVAMLAGFAIAVVTTPVGVSGAVFLLPVQVSILGVPSPAVTPTNLLFNVISVPGALARYRRQGTLRSDLTARLVAGTLPGVVVGAVVRVFVVPDGAVFRLLIALLLLPIGTWLLIRALTGGPAPRGSDLLSGASRSDSGTDRNRVRRGGRSRQDRNRRRAPSRAAALVLFGLAAGFVGGVYGIGGGSILAPVLVGLGYALPKVAPAALVSTFLTSVAGVAAYIAIAAAGHGAAAPHWGIAFGCGLGGLAGGFVGAGLQRRIPARALTAGLGAVAVAVALAYLAASTGTLG